MNYLFKLGGGIGKNIAFTAVISALKKAHPESKIVVASAYPYIFFHNPEVSENYNINLEYPKYGKDWTVIDKDVYDTESFKQRKGHIIDNWCEMLGIEPQYQGHLYFTEGELEEAKKRLPTGKPLFFIQTNGGVRGLTKINQCHGRDLPQTVAQKIVDEASETHTVIHVKDKLQPYLRNTWTCSATTREWLAMLTFSDKRLFTDSFAQHACSALNLPSKVIWLGNVPSQFGYKIHENIQIQLVPAPAEQNYAEAYDLMDNPVKYPFDLSKFVI